MRKKANRLAAKKLLPLTPTADKLCPFINETLPYHEMVSPA